MTPEQTTKVKDLDLQQAFTADGQFCLSLLKSLLQLETDNLPGFAPITWEIDGHKTRVTVYCANASQTANGPQTEQQTQLRSLLTAEPTLKDSVIRKLNNNSTFTKYTQEGLKEFNYLRPHSIFIFLVRDLDNNELLILVEGLDDGNVGAVHTDLRAINFIRQLVNQVFTDIAAGKDCNHTPVQRMYSGHQWGSIILTDSSSDTDPHQRLSIPNCFYQKMVQILNRNGFVVINDDN